MDYDQEINKTQEALNQSHDPKYYYTLGSLYLDKEGGYIGCNAYRMWDQGAEHGDKQCLKALINDFLNMEEYEDAARYLIKLLSLHGVTDFDWFVRNT